MLAVMGAWSGEPFGNDTAADFAWELDESADWSPVSAALDDVLTEGGWLDADLASIGIAAAEVVARALGRPTQSDAYTEGVGGYVSRVGAPPADLVDKAERVLRAAQTPGSELRQLWDESDPTEWLTANARIGEALRG